MKKIFFVMFVVVFCFGLQNVSAQDNGQSDIDNQVSLTELPEDVEFVDDIPLPDSDVDGATYGSDEIYVPEVTVELSDILFDEYTHEFTAVTTVTNTTDTFLDNLEYTLELMKGDELVDDGYIFDTTEHVYQETHDLDKLAPNETREFELMMTVPGNIDTANYFLQIFVNDKNLKFQNGTYTQQPFELTGTGGRLAGLKVYFYADRYGEKTFPSAGLSTEPDDYVMLMVPLGENQSVKELVDAGEQLRAKVQIFRTVKDSGLVKEFETNFDRKDVNGEDSIFVDLLADNEELKNGGSFDVHIAVLDEGGTELYERNMRWLIEFGQIVGRVLSVESGKNVYKKGEVIDLVVTTALFNSEDKKGKFDVVLKGRDGFEQKITKTVTFTGDETEEILFSDQKIDADTHLTDIAVSLTDVEKGVVVDAYNTDIDFDEVYGREVEKQNTFIIFLQNNQYIIWIVGSIIFGLLAIVIFKAMERRKVMRIVIIFLLGINIFFLTSHTAEALCQCSRRPSANIWIHRAPPSRVTCGANARMEVALRVSCRACINGLATRISTSAGTGMDSAYGHVSSATKYHAFSQRIDRRTLMWAKAWFIRNGCHCCPRPGGRGCSPGVANGSMCSINVFIGQVAKWVDCDNPARNGQCGTRHGRTYPYNAVGWGGGTFCNPNSTTRPQWPVFPSQGGRTNWQCLGSNGGRTVSCWARRNPPPTINGACSSGKITSPIPYTQTAWKSTIPTHFCAKGTPSPNPPTFPSYGTTATWKCLGSGPDHKDSGNCSVTRQSPPPCACNTSARKDFPFDATGWGFNVNVASNFCSAGLPTPATPGFPARGGSVSWTCGGSSCTGNAAQCTATRQLPPPCECDAGINGGTQIPFNETNANWSTRSFCAVGNPLGGMPTLPNQGQSVSWICGGTDCTDPDANCTASRGTPP
ncbi:MAG: hypothetical protein U9Q12_01395, partial [Patescibacteria group bacterium]|nr:hypothetical protein [Patescibacteria group bacterium]